jgi:putative isomerase
VSRDDPTSKDNTYWRGRIWPTINYLVWQGLRRCGQETAARVLADQSFALFRRSWEGRRLCPENFNAITGEPLDQPDTEGFYSWGALMAMLGVVQIMNIGPWHGWEITNDGKPATLGPIESPIGPVTVLIKGGVLTLAKGRRRLLVTNVRGTISHLLFEEGVVSLVLPAVTDKGAFLHFPDIMPENVQASCIDGVPAAITSLAAGIALKDLSRARKPREARIYLRTAPVGKNMSSI